MMDVLQQKEIRGSTRLLSTLQNCRRISPGYVSKDDIKPEVLAIIAA
jgi:hypothetical protein